MPGVLVDDEGITFSQSWVNTFFNCPRQAQLELLGKLPYRSTDATAIGTATHAGIEFVLGGNKLDDGEQCALDTFDYESQQDHFEWVSVKTKDTAVEQLKRVYWRWANEVYPQLPAPLGVEAPFTATVGQSEHGAIRITGSADLIDEFHEIWDWKTANGFRMWNQWEVDRYKIQPTFYSYGLMLAGLIPADEPVTFNYCVMNKQSEDHLIFTTTRDSQHWCWLVEQLTHIAGLIRSGLEVWPTNDQSALCSQKWCPAWTMCKGKHFPDTLSPTQQEQ